MIISYRHEFIFVKTRKTGGTSVEIALAALCGEDDVITPITPVDEMVRIEAGMACRNYCSDPALEAEHLAALKRDGSTHRLSSELRAAQVYRNHMSLDELSLISPAIVDTYRTISIERHPYEKAVSLANFRMGAASYNRGEGLAGDIGEIRSKVDAMIDDGSLQPKIRNWDLYTRNGLMHVDHMMRHESLAADFTALCEALSFSLVAELPRTKVSTRDRTIPAAEILSHEQREIVQDVCAEEFLAFGYEV